MPDIVLDSGNIAGNKTDKTLNLWKWIYCRSGGNKCYKEKSNQAKGGVESVFA